VLARDLDVPILALSQLSRAVEQRQDKRPILSDLRESGSIEQDADLVFFVYRDEYYAGEESESQGLAEIILSKHRNGPTGFVKLSFLKRYAKFADLAPRRNACPGRERRHVFGMRRWRPTWSSRLLGSPAPCGYCPDVILDADVVAMARASIADSGPRRRKQPAFTRRRACPPCTGTRDPGHRLRVVTEEVDELPRLLRAESSTRSPLVAARLGRFFCGDGRFAAGFFRPYSGSVAKVASTR
jgi:hypothetical protein